MKKVKIIDSTLGPNKQTEEMIGGVFDVKEINYPDNTIRVYNKDRSNFWWFNLSDVQEVCGGATFNGELICVGDKIDDEEVYDWYVYDDKINLLTGSKSNSYYRYATSIGSHTPKCSKKIETITIGDHSYDKKQVEEALSKIKAIK